MKNPCHPKGISRGEQKRNDNNFKSLQPVIERIVQLASDDGAIKHPLTVLQTLHHSLYSNLRWGNSDGCILSADESFDCLLLSSFG